MAGEHLLTPYGPVGTKRIGQVRIADVVGLLNVKSFVQYVCTIVDR